MSKGLPSLPTIEDSGYQENTGDQFLWWLSTAEPEIIYDCKVDRNRYRITGLIVLGTWLFATMAWTYFFSTTVNNPWMYVPLGMFMGFIVLTIDRALIKGINKSNRNKLGPLVFRGLLALTIGLFMAQPAVLYLFDKEVKLQSSLDNEQRKIAKRKQLEALFAGEKMALDSEKVRLQRTLDIKYAEVEKARNNFLAETDGSGGSGKVGISTIAIAKRNEYQQLASDYKLLQSGTQPKIDTLSAQLAGISATIKTQELQFAALLNDGFLTRIEALQNLIAANYAVAFRYYLIIAILMLIELMPVIIKSLLPSGPYEEKVRLIEASEKEMAQRNMDREAALKTYFNEAATKADQQAIDAFFALTHQRRVDKMDGLADQWSNDKFQRFDGLWRKVKREVFPKQEG